MVGQDHLLDARFEQHLRHAADPALQGREVARRQPEVHFFMPERAAVHDAPDRLSRDQHACVTEPMTALHERAVLREPSGRRKRHAHRRIVRGFDHVAIALQEHRHLVAIPTVDREWK